MAIDREALKRVPGGIKGGVCRDLFEEDGHLVNHARQDCTPIVDANKRLKSHEQYGSKHMRGYLAARVPDIYYYVLWPQEFEKRYGMKRNASVEARRLWRDFFLKKLDDPDFRDFRVDERKLAGTKEHG